VFELAVQEGRVDDWRRQLVSIKELMGDRALAQVLRNPTIPASRRMELSLKQGS